VTATRARPRPRAPSAPPTPAALWRLIPPAVRARVPQSADVRGCAHPALLCAVGPGAPVRWLLVIPAAFGALDVRLSEVRRASTVRVAAARTTPAGLDTLLQRWAVEHLS
jgi:hypothetical protein